ncbi:MAG: orotidine-5'-phosphate decarboxylase [Acidobacteria bacterium]|nr:orotidine-5'-phosphate decarboxylase [Acidobacteriota bacterium]
MNSDARRRLIIALDYPHIRLAYSLAKLLAGLAGMFKIGSQLFTAEGPAAVQKLASLGPGIFLDLKFHDIANTVAGALSAAATLPGVRLINVHALGGLEMMRAAARAVRAHARRPKLLAVTVLTSLDARAMEQVGIGGPLGTRAVKLARLARQAGLDGVVASAHEVSRIRRACGKGFLIAVPGVRPEVSGRHPRSSQWADDQIRVATSAEAIRAGADYIVVGRPITAARDPRAAAEAILEEISSALRARI